METKVALSMSMVVPQVLLDDNNYPDWSVRIRTYLKGRDLWEIVDDEPPNQEDDVTTLKAWNTKNFMALYVIQNGCGPEAFRMIRYENSAKDAWRVLAAKFEPKPKDANTGVYELLGKKNYDSWSVQVKTYLELHHLWDDVGHEPDNSKAALDVIKKYCGPTMMSVIEMCASAKEAWEKLFKAGLRPLLNKINYVSWGVRVKTYLELHHLWDDVGHEPNNSKAALDVIKKSCGPTMMSVIEKCDSAKDAWEKLCEADIALDLLQRTPLPKRLIGRDIYGNTPLSVLASQPSISFSKSRLLFWERWIYACIPKKLVHSSTYKRKEVIEFINETRIDIDKQNQQQSHEVNVYRSVLRLLHWILLNLLKLQGMKHIYELRVHHVQALELQGLFSKVIAPHLILMGNIFLKEKIFLKAVKAGNHEFIENILRENPKLLLLTDSNSRSLFAYAVLYRQPRIFSLIYNLEAKEELINMPDKSGNTLLRMAGMLELATDQIQRIPSAALQMTRELQWFKEIEGMSSIFTREMKNDSGETAKETFTKKHKDMKDAGEKWMKETASSSSVVGALIITITFAAVITVPGGNNGDNGFPVFSDKPIFLIFVISNALSFVSSIAAVLTFLVILTTSYAEEDFMSSLPRKMATGLYTLSFSIATMMIAFCAALFIMMPGKSWITILIICLASISVIMFLLDKYPNLNEMTKSAYGAHMFYKKLKSGLSKGMPLATVTEF